jgi:hypothetical protein
MRGIPQHQPDAAGTGAEVEMEARPGELVVRPVHASGKPHDGRASDLGDGGGTDVREVEARRALARSVIEDCW